MNSIVTLPHTVPWTIMQSGLFSDARLESVFIAPFLDTDISAIALLSYQSLALESGEQLLGCTAFSVSSVLFFRQWIRRMFASPTDGTTTDFIGDSVKVTQTIPIHGLGRVLYRGSEWSARTTSGKTHKPGDGATIRRVEGIILVVE